MSAFGHSKDILRCSCGVFSSSLRCRSDVFLFFPSIFLSEKKGHDVLPSFFWFLCWHLYIGVAVFYDLNMLDLCLSGKFWSKLSSQLSCLIIVEWMVLYFAEWPSWCRWTCIVFFFLPNRCIVKLRILTTCFGSFDCCENSIQAQVSATSNVWAFLIFCMPYLWQVLSINWKFTWETTMNKMVILVSLITPLSWFLSFFRDSPVFINSFCLLHILSVNILLL